MLFNINDLHFCCLSFWTGFSIAQADLVFYSPGWPGIGSIDEDDHELCWSSCIYLSLITDMNQHNLPPSVTLEFHAHLLHMHYAHHEQPTMVRELHTRRELSASSFTQLQCEASNPRWVYVTQSAPWMYVNEHQGKLSLKLCLTSNLGCKLLRERKSKHEYFKLKMIPRNKQF